jgi:hypothetical protein
MSSAIPGVPIVHTTHGTNTSDLSHMISRDFDVRTVGCKKKRELSE